MTPTALREALEVLRWTQRGLADVLGTHQTTVRRWATGQQEIPASVADWLDNLANFHRESPLPVGWNSKEAA